MLSRASATVAALGTAALAATALPSFTSPAIGAATAQQWLCAGATDYPASIPTFVSADRSGVRLYVTVETFGQGVPTGKVEGATTQYTGPTGFDPDASVSSPTALASDPVSFNGTATLTFTNAHEDKFVGYIPTGNFCASGTSFAQ